MRIDMAPFEKLIREKAGFLSKKMPGKISAKKFLSESLKKRRIQQIAI
ncbi:MAG: hypothetical protein HC887_10280 [Desulfobacteraceae bacterium]|nr:hypothetical protein [Desulfobacteraceae bacterium]